MTWKCPNCWSEYEVDPKYEAALKDKKDCKFCVRKDPDIPTTAQMDGLLTPEEMRSRNTVMFQCINCNKWTPHENWIPGASNQHVPCEGCGKIQYDPTSIKSLHTYKPETDNKRRFKAKKK